ncbi:hypothetical protein KCP73_24935 [Salmonella enterica subsp. enterica]|nr:hypothetical protein KCP73_24935 [Salmonella enterica subsp. enterica]
MTTGTGNSVTTAMRQEEIAIFFLKSPDCGGNMQHVEKIAAMRRLSSYYRAARCKMMADG